MPEGIRTVLHVPETSSLVAGPLGAGACRDPPPICAGPNDQPFEHRPAHGGTRAGGIDTRDPADGGSSWWTPLRRARSSRRWPDGGGFGGEPGNRDAVEC